MRKMLQQIAAISFILLAGVWAPSQHLIPKTAPASLEYVTQSAGGESRFFFRIWQTSPDLIMEWEEDFRLGAVVLPAKEMEKSRKYFRKKALENGRRIKLAGTILLLSREVFMELKNDGKSVLLINNLPGWLRKTGEGFFKLEGQSIPVILAEDKQGQRYQFQDDPAFPLCLLYETAHHSDRLFHFHQGEDVMFRWKAGLTGIPQ